MSQLNRHSAIYMAGRVGPALINLFATAVYTRLATPGEYSYLVIANSIAQLGSASLFQWLRLSLLRLAPSESPEKMLGTMGFLYSIQSIVAVALSIFSYSWFKENPGGVYFWGLSVSMLLCQAWFDLTQELQRSALKPKNYSITFAIRSALGLVLGFFSLYIWGSGLLLVGCVALSLLISPIFFNSWIFSINPKFDLCLARRIIIYGWPLCISMLLASATTMGDRLFIAYLMDLESAGSYGPSADLAKQSIFVLAQSISLAGLPLALRALKNKGVDAAKEQMKSNYELTLFISMSASVALAMMSEEVGYIFFGAEFRESSDSILPIVAIGSFAMSMRMFYFDQAMQLGENTKGQILVGLALFLSSILMWIYLIPSYGILGAALSGALSQIIGLLFSALIGRRVFKLPIPWRATLVTSFCCLIMAASIFLAKLFFLEIGFTQVFFVSVVAIISLSSAAIIFGVPAFNKVKGKIFKVVGL